MRSGFPRLALLLLTLLAITPAFAGNASYTPNPTKQTGKMVVPQFNLPGQGIYSAQMATSEAGNYELQAGLKLSVSKNAEVKSAAAVPATYTPATHKLFIPALVLKTKSGWAYYDVTLAQGTGGLDAFGVPTNLVVESVVDTQVGVPSAGPAGEAGAQGPQGDPGIKGDKGDIGDTGLQGIQGDVGPKGDKGDAGIQGVQGDVGLKGDKGDQGDIGQQGLQGVPGISGASIQTNSLTDITDTKTVSVACPTAGQIVIGGGYTTDISPTVFFVQQSYPSAADTWKVVARNTNAVSSWTLTVYAICVNAQP